MHYIILSNLFFKLDQSYSFQNLLPSFSAWIASVKQVSRYQSRISLSSFSSCNSSFQHWGEKKYERRTRCTASSFPSSSPLLALWGENPSKYPSCLSALYFYEKRTRLGGTILATLLSDICAVPSTEVPTYGGSISPRLCQRKPQPNSSFRALPNMEKDVAGWGFIVNRWARNLWQVVCLIICQWQKINDNDKTVKEWECKADN